MPDLEALSVVLRSHQQRLRLAATASALMVGAVAASLVALALTLAGVSLFRTRSAAVAVFAVTAGSLAARWWRQWTLLRVARAIESRISGLDNIVVTAEEILSASRGAVHPLLREAVLEAANARLKTVPMRSVQPLRTSATMAALVVTAAAVVLLWVPKPPVGSSEPRAATAAQAVTALDSGDLRVVISPPGYTGRPATAFINPSEVTAIEGSRVTLEAAADAGRVELAEPGREPVAFSLTGDRWSYQLSATESRVLMIQRRGVAANVADRLLYLRVDDDRRPLVRITTPAKDLIFSDARGHVPVEIEARDDLGLASLSLRYTRVAGSGETFTFEEGEAPVVIARTSSGEWRGRAMLTLEALELADGDTLVYRATASDGKPGADPSASDAFLIEIGRVAGLASTGFAVPEERERQAISQQMLIIKTEHLNAERPRLGRETFEEQSRLLAVEQRMVKAEFVFMTGGEVADEVQEAEHAHELVEGRLENVAQVELLAAIREMSRAEARLNAADTEQALTFERTALAALQRAFDRRRYLLRALPERARIDPSRRLTGNLSAARTPARRPTEPPADQTVERARDVMRELAEAIQHGERLTTVLASKLVAVDPSSETLKQAAMQAASEPDLHVRVSAAWRAQRLLADIVRNRLAVRPRQGVVDNPIAGLFADEAMRLRGSQ